MYPFKIRVRVWSAYSDKGYQASTQISGKLHTFVVYKRMIMKKLLLFCLCFFMLLPVYLFGANKPKTIILAKDLNKKPTLVYTGEVNKKIPNGKGVLKCQKNRRALRDWTLNDYYWTSDEIFVVTGTFDGYNASNALVEINRGERYHLINYQGDVDIVIKDNLSVQLILTKGIINTPSGNLQVSNLSFATTPQSGGELSEVGENTFIREHSCTLKEQDDYRYIDSFGIGLLKSFGGESSVIVDYEEYGTLDEFMRGRYNLKIDNVFLKWEDGRTDTLEFSPTSIKKDYDGKVSFPWLELSKKDHQFINANGDIILQGKSTYYKKCFPNGVVEYDSANYSFNLRTDLPDDLKPYLEDFPGSNYYDSRGKYHYIPPVIGTECKITYSDGAVYNGTVKHIENDNIFSLSSLPDSSMYWLGIYTAPSGIRTIYYLDHEDWGESEQKKVNEKDFIAQSEANRIAKEEAKAEQERLEREEQERQEKEAKEREDRLVRTYGKYYTEFRDNGKILLGAPIKMFKELTTVRLQINRRDMQVYEVWYDDGLYDYMYCVVNPKTGKVTETRPNPWNE